MEPLMASMGMLLHKCKCARVRGRGVFHGIKEGSWATLTTSTTPKPSFRNDLCALSATLSTLQSLSSIAGLLLMGQGHA
eukprot:1159917-Pelagomonas_calceolata.AAC.2